MIVKTTYDEVRRYFPEAFITFAEKQEGSHSKHKSLPFEELEYQYRLYISHYRNQNDSLQGIFERVASGESERIARERKQRDKDITEFEYKTDLLKRLGGTVEAHYKRMYLGHRINFQFMSTEIAPPSILEFLEKNWQAHKGMVNRQNEFDSLTEDEKTRRLNESMRSLLKDTGFVPVKIVKRDKI